MRNGEAIGPKSLISRASDARETEPYTTYMMRCRSARRASINRLPPLNPVRKLLGVRTYIGARPSYDPLSKGSYPMPRVALTLKVVEALPIPVARKSVDYFDRRLPGLVLRVSSGGTKSWNAVYRHH